MRRRDFRRTYLAIAISELGDAFQYVALMWIALESGGPLGLIAVHLADSVPAFIFGFHPVECSSVLVRAPPGSC